MEKSDDRRKFLNERQQAHGFDRLPFKTVF